MQLQFQFRFTKDSEEVLFAFCFPFSYDDCNKDLERCEDQVGMRTGAALTVCRGFLLSLSGMRRGGNKLALMFTLLCLRHTLALSGYAEA